MGIEEHIRGFEGITLAGYGVEVKQGKHVSTPQGEFVEMRNGEEYSIKVVNLNSHRCQFKLNIDGQQQGTWQISSLSSGSIERPADIAKKFTFYRVKCAPKGSGIQAGRSENGLVTCSFTPEKGAESVNFQLSLPCHSPTVNSSIFSMFAKHLGEDLTDKIKEILAVKYNISDSSDYDVIRWYSEEPTGYMLGLVDLEGKEIKEIGLKPFLGSRYYGYWEHSDSKHYLDCLPKIKSIRIKYEGETFHHNTQATPTIKVISQMVRNLGLKKFHMKTESGRYICSSRSSKTTGMKHVYTYLKRADILDAVRARALTIEVVDYQSDDAFEVQLKTLSGESISLLLTDDNTAEEIKQMIQDKEGIPPDQQRLIVSGKQMEDTYHVFQYPALREKRTIHLVLKLRGGGGVIPTLQANSELKAVGKKFGKKSLDTPDSDWVSGATALGKASRQTFRRAAPMEVDPSKETTLILRLVARGDELVAHPQVDDFESTPQSSQVPPPVPV